MFEIYPLSFIYGITVGVIATVIVMIYAVWKDERQNDGRTDVKEKDDTRSNGHGVP